jgi:hypothetical protein
MKIERRLHDRGEDKSARRKLQVLVFLAVVLTAAAFWWVHVSGVLKG